MNKKFSISSFLIGFYLVCGTSSVMAIKNFVVDSVTIVPKSEVKPLIQESAISPGQKLVALLSDPKKAVETFSTLDSETQVELFNGLDSKKQVKLLNGFTPEKQVKLLNLLSPEKQLELFNSLPLKKAVTIFNLPSPEKQLELLNGLSPEKKLELLNGLSPEKKLELFNSLPSKKAVTIFNLLSPAEKLIAYPNLNEEAQTEIRYNFAQLYGKKGAKLLQRTVEIKGNKTGKIINCSDYKREDGKTEKALKKYLQKQAAAEAKATSEKVAEQNANSGKEAKETSEKVAEQNANSGKEAKATSETKRKAPFDDFLKLFKKPRQ